MTYLQEVNEIYYKGLRIYIQWVNDLFTRVNDLFTRG